jgi:hypothetical protein
MKKIILCAVTTFAFILLIHGRSLQSQPAGVSDSKGSTPLGPAGNNQSKSSSNKDGKNGKDSADKGKDQPNTIEGYQTKDLWREGARVIQMTGQFQVNGEIIQFTSSDAKLQITVIQNLMLQRVHQTITETADVKDHDWVINGIITEYRNANFIILTHAVLKTKAAQKDLILNKTNEPISLAKPGANP